MLQTIVHYVLHFIAIGAIAYWYDKKHWKRAWLILLATMLVDLDHIFATPMFDPDRCSIGFHPLHTPYAAVAYLLGSIFIKHRITRLVCIGLLFHLLTDLVDCLWMNWSSS